MKILLVIYTITNVYSGIHSTVISVEMDSPEKCEEQRKIVHKQMPNEIGFTVKTICIQGSK